MYFYNSESSYPASPKPSKSSPRSSPQTISSGSDQKDNDPQSKAEANVVVMERNINFLKSHQTNLIFGLPTNVLDTICGPTWQLIKDDCRETCFCNWSIYLLRVRVESPCDTCPQCQASRECAKRVREPAEDTIKKYM